MFSLKYLSVFQDVMTAQQPIKRRGRVDSVKLLQHNALAIVGLPLPARYLCQK